MTAAGDLGVDRGVPSIEVELRPSAPHDRHSRGRLWRRRGRRRGTRWPFWDATCAALAAHPVFAKCSPRQIRSITRLGDVVEIGEGSVVVHEDRIGYWFLAIFDGAVTLSRRDVPVAALGPGDHVGDVAIIGFGPNPTTVTAESAVRAFVIGRRHLLTLTQLAPVQAGLFRRTGDSYVDHVRVLRSAGEQAWRALPRGRQPPPLTRESLPASFRLVSPKSVRASGLAASALTRPPDGPTPPAPAIRISRRALALLVSTVVAAALVVAFTARPPVVVVRPAPAVDISRDITITGAASHPVRGRYLLVAVRVEQPTLAGWGWAALRGDHIEPFERRGEVLAEERRVARQEFVASRTSAARQAVIDAGLDPATVTIDVRDRDLIGPSAGLVYALAIEDMLDADDVARGRGVAATGVIGEGGRVSAVGWIAFKAGAARASRADLFLVPRGQELDAVSRHVRVVPVATVAEARARLLSTASTPAP